MENSDGKRVPELFGEALDRPAAERAEWLARACGGDDVLQAEVERLLRAHDEAGEFIETPVLAQPADQPTRELAGERIGPYQLVRELGRGGMGVVYLAERADGEFRKQVAIKLLPASADDGERQRFRRERQILADLEHPNIARLLDGGTLNERPYVVMEFVPGQSLREILRARGALPPEEVNAIVQQVCAGLAEAHERGVVHRDIKPENLIVTERQGRPHATILDFGIAKLQQQTTTARTQTAVILGTVNYMSPEQAVGAGNATIDARSDVYSLGMVIYEMLTGAPAFKGDSYLGVLYQHQHARPAPPHEARRDLAIPPAVSEVVVKALAKDPAARQQSARQLAEEFARASGPGAGRSRPVRQWRKAILRAAAGIMLALFMWSAWAIFSWSRRPAPVKPYSLQYRVLKKTGAGAETVLQSPHSKGVVRPGDAIQFEFTLPFAAHYYLFFEESEGTLVWVNPRPGLPPQHGMAGEALRVPENIWIPYEEEKQRKQLFIAVYVPDATPWSLEDVVPQAELKKELKVNLDVVHFPYARIRQPFTAQLLKVLEEKALPARFLNPPVDGRYTMAIPQPAAPETAERRMVFHKVELWHLE